MEQLLQSKTKDQSAHVGRFLPAEMSKDNGSLQEIHSSHSLRSNSWTALRTRIHPRLSAESSAAGRTSPTSISNRSVGSPATRVTLTASVSAEKTPATLVRPPDLMRRFADPESTHPPATIPNGPVFKERYPTRLTSRDGVP